MSEEKQENRDDASGARAEKLTAKARPKQTSLPMSSSPRVKIPFNMREWIDVEPREYDQHSFDVAKKMNRLLRHDLRDLRYEDGAVEFKILAMFASKFESSPQWSIRTWLRYCEEEEVPRRDSSIAWIPTQPALSSTFEQFKAILEEIKSELQDNVLFTKRLCRVHLPRWRFPDVKNGRQTVFFTDVNPMVPHLHKPRDCDVTKPRVAVYRQNWKIHQNTVYWINFRAAQKKGLTFYQRRSNTIILHNSPSSLY